MRRNSNYFADVSRFFLKAKQREKLALDPEIKNHIRGALELKINELKFMPDEATAQPAKKHLADETPKQSFWRTWRYQFIGVPASLFALMLIVFAANNFKFALPAAQDFTPDSNDFSNAIKVSIVETIEEKPLIVETETKPEEKPKPELLILDINDLGKRDLNPIPAIKTAEQSAQNLTAQPVTVQTTEQSDTTQKTTSVQTADETDNAVITESEGAPSPEIIADRPQTESDVQEDAQTIQTETADEPAPQTSVSLDTAEEEIKNPEPEKISTSDLATRTSVAENTNVLLKSIKNENYAVSYYGTSSFVYDPGFDKAIIDKLISDKNPSAVNVYYTDETHVTVEVKLEEVTKSYTYEKKGLEWTIAKFWSLR